MTTLTTTKKTRKGKLVGNKHVETLIGTYKKQRWVQNSEKIGKADALSAWYGLDELSAFLELAREHQADGIKMYYGVYPDNYVEEPEYAGRQTVVLVATRKDQTGHGYVNKNIYTSRNGESQILAFNVGELCPPYCGLWPNPDGTHIGIDMEKIGLSIIDQNGEIKIA